MTETQKQPLGDEQEIIRSRMGLVKHKIIVLSGKGGVGKSTVAANLAVSLAGQGRKVGLLDIDIHGPSIPELMGLSASSAELVESAGGGSSLKPVSMIPGLGVMSIGFMLQNRDAAVIWRGPMKYNMIKQFLKDVEWGALDYLIVDSPPGTGDEPLSVVQLLGNPTGAVIVTTPQELAISDVRKSVTFCRQLKLPVLGVIENMSGFVCPSCGEVVDIFKRGGGQKMAEEMNIPFLSRIPLDPDFVEAGDNGTPYMERFADTETAQCFKAAVEAILKKTEPADDAGNTKQGSTGMKIAIPLVNGSLSAHFGHCEEFALVETEPESKSIKSIRNLTPPPHEPGVLPRWLADEGANMIIAGGMGGRAKGLFEEQNIKVIVGAPSAGPEEIVNAYMAGSLAIGENVCDH